MFQHLLQSISRHPQQKTKLLNGYFPIHGASELLEPHRELVDTIRQYFGVPETVWVSTHEQLLNNYAQRVQLLPANEDDHHTEPGGLLRHSLETANHAIKIRRGYMLPNGASSERISEQQEIWNFAVLCAALLHDIGKSITQATISLRNHEGNESRWSLVYGDIPLDASYRLQFRRQPPDQYHQTIPLLIAGQIIPLSALQWLTHYPEVFSVWRLTLSGQYDEAGVFGEIIRKISHDAQKITPSQKEKCKSKNQEQRNSSPPSSSSESETPQIDLQYIVLPPGMEQVRIHSHESETNEQRNQSESGGGSQPIIQPSAFQPNNRGQSKKEVAQQFVQWLRQQIIDGKIGINAPNAQLQRVAEGLLLVSPAIFKRYLRDEEHIELNNHELKMLQSGFLSLGIHKPLAHKQTVWTYRYQGKKSDSMLHGMLIPDPLTVLKLDELPEVNPFMSAEMPKAGNINQSGVSNDNNNLTIRKP